MKLTIGAAALWLAFVVAATATAATALTKAQYVAKLRAANVASAKADDAVMLAFQSKTTTAAQVRAKLVAMGKEHLELGKQFAALTPPRAAAKANTDFAHAEQLFGRQNEAIARRLPATKAAMLKFLQSVKPPSGGKLLDHAIAELHAAGFKI